MTSRSATATQIQVVYPHPEHVVFEDSTFLMGSVRSAPAGAKLYFNGQPVPLSPKGFFAWKIPIHAGMNPIQLEVRVNTATPPLAQAIFALRGEPSLPVLPKSPLAVNAETLQPANDLWLMPTDTLTVACLASEGAQVSFTIPGWVDTPVSVPPYLHHALYLDTREVIFSQKHWTAPRIPTRGYYQARVPVKTLLPSHPESFPQQAAIVLQVQSGTQSLKKTVPGRLTVLTSAKAAVLKTDRVVTRKVPPNGDRLTPQRANTAVWVDGLQSAWARVVLSPEEYCYVPLDSLTFTPATTVPEPMALDSIQIDSLSPVDSRVRLQFQQKPAQACPIQLESIPSERMDRLQVRLYGVCGPCDFIQSPPDDAVVRQIHWRAVADTVLELWIDLKRPLIGYDYTWQAGEWRIQVRTLPSRIAEVQILIDPGHGGAEWGSTGLNGLPEKQLNLTVSRLLRDALLQAGFQASLTRNSDQALSLQERGDQVIHMQPHMVLSLHHNALPDGRDPLKAEGACCFYYHAFSRPLAEKLLQGLTEPVTGYQAIPNYGLFDDSLYMTRIHQALAVLIEVGFFTNPTEFERLIDPAFHKQVVARLVSALRAYCLPA
ncbi:N-acetylmuramoyl-L-alanine amidase family protein [Vampirovibrio chlorellavorus]|uniref:N-acetylmuramoyl-L-alanine amidase family protein n=1 Tax=Vampirovibrio chlorellavorus TaxID=758823 RepID=UPI0026F0B2F7|nr:N-acetylmuramoyl-L-alanine amidase [Vampirovibrio chlorellavorus]